jgi:hypothetical protein
MKNSLEKRVDLKKGQGHGTFFMCPNFLPSSLEKKTIDIASSTK